MHIVANAEHVTDDDNEEPAGPHKAADERVYGVVPRPATQNGPGEPENAQFRDIEATRRRMETTHRMPKAAVHRRGQAIEVNYGRPLFVRQASGARTPADMPITNQ